MSNKERSDSSLSRMVQARQAELALLRTVIDATGGSLELDALLGSILRSTRNVLGSSISGMALLADSSRHGLKIAAHLGLEPNDVPKRIFVQDCLCEQVLESGMPVFGAACAVQGCPLVTEDRSEAGHLAFPLLGRQGVLGVICVSCELDAAVEDWDLSFWSDVGRLAGKAVEDASLYAQLLEQRDLMQVLFDVSNHLATSLDLDWVLSKILDLAIVATDAQDGSIFLLPEAGSSAARILRRDLSAPQADLVIEQVVGQGLAGWVVRHKMGAIVGDTSNDPRWLSFSDEDDPPGSALAVPLMADDQVLGVLTLNDMAVGRFKNRHLVLMTAIAHQASAAIEKARLYKEVTHLAGVLEQRVEERTRELRETQAQLLHAEKLAALGELAAGVAHEINNPLHILQAYVEYMASTAQDGDAILELLEPMQNSLESIAHLTSQLRDFSRPALGERKPVILNEIVTKVLNLANKELMHSKVAIRELLAPDLPAVLGDARQLEQVFLNLMLNARDAMPGGGELTIESYADTGDVYVRFADTGIGISEDDLARIFEPYFTTKADRGTGLGLAICQRIVTQHGGKLTVSSKLGQGATFVVRIPMALDVLGEAVPVSRR